MSAKIPWQEPQNRSIIFICLGFAALFEFFIVLYVSFYFPINNIYVYIFGSLGVILFLTGIEILFAQIIHSLRIYFWQKRATKKKVGLKKVSMNWSIFIGAGISLGLFVSLYFIFSYYILDPFVLINLPIYGKFILIEILSGIVAVIIVAVIDSALPKT